MSSDDKPATIELGGKEWRRIPYGREQNSQAVDHEACPDCGVGAGELHVTNCDVEACPACGLQLLMCIALERHEAVSSGDHDDSPWAGHPYGPPARRSAWE